jgi:acyl carrier protein
VTELASERIRETIFSVLAQRGQPAPAEDEPLFSTGRLDSLAATEVLTMLEADFGIDLADEDFDILQIDTLRDIEALLSTHKVAA